MSLVSRAPQTDNKMHQRKKTRGGKIVEPAVSVCVSRDVYIYTREEGAEKNDFSKWLNLFSNSPQRNIGYAARGRKLLKLVFRRASLQFAEKSGFRYVILGAILKDQNQQQWQRKTRAALKKTMDAYGTMHLKITKTNPLCVYYDNRVKKEHCTWNKSFRESCHDENLAFLEKLYVPAGNKSYTPNFHRDTIFPCEIPSYLS